MLGLDGVVRRLQGDARRSNEKQALSEMTGKTLLLPKDPAFHPAQKGLEWRVQNLVAYSFIGAHPMC